LECHVAHHIRCDQRELENHVGLTLCYFKRRSLRRAVGAVQVCIMPRECRGMQPGLARRCVAIIQLKIHQTFDALRLLQLSTIGSPIERAVLDMCAPTVVHCPATVHVATTHLQARGPDASQRHEADMSRHVTAIRMRPAELFARVLAHQVCISVTVPPARTCLCRQRTYCQARR
jgi:hypothetical protein